MRYIFETIYDYKTSSQKEKVILSREQENREKSKEELLSLQLLETAFSTG